MKVFLLGIDVRRQYERARNPELLVLDFHSALISRLIIIISLYVGIGILAVEVRHIICFSLDIFSRIIHRSQIADYELRTGGEMIGIIVNVYAPVFLFVSSKAIPTVAESEQHIRHIVDGCIVSRVHISDLKKCTGNRIIHCFARSDGDD